MCDTYYCEYMLHTTFCFYIIDFQLDTDSLPNFAFFTVKSPSVTQRSVSQENAFIKRAIIRQLFFFRKTIGSNNSFIVIENNFRFLR